MFYHDHCWIYCNLPNVIVFLSKIKKKKTICVAETLNLIQKQTVNKFITKYLNFGYDFGESSNGVFMNNDSWATMPWISGGGGALPLTAVCVC